MKDHPVILGLDDGSFSLYESQQVNVYGVIMRGKLYTDAILRCTIEMDDLDPTSKIIAMIVASKHRVNIQVILHQGATIGGFGILDPKRIYETLNIPVLFVLKSKPDELAVKHAVMQLESNNLRLEQLNNLPEIESINDLFMQRVGLSTTEAESILKSCTATGKIPEALRLAHLIGSLDAW